MLYCMLMFWLCDVHDVCIWMFMFWIYMFLDVHGQDVDDILDDIFGFIVLWMIWWMYFLLFCVILQQMLQLQQLLQFFLKTVANCVEYTCIRRNYRTIIASNFNSMQMSTEYYIFSL